MAPRALFALVAALAVFSLAACQSSYEKAASKPLSNRDAARAFLNEVYSYEGKATPESTGGYYVVLQQAASCDATRDGPSWLLRAVTGPRQEPSRDSLDAVVLFHEFGQVVNEYLRIGPFRIFVQRLKEIPTDNPTLLEIVRLSSIVDKEVAKYEQVPVPSICPTLARWRDTGWSRKFVTAANYPSWPYPAAAARVDLCKMKKTHDRALKLVNRLDALPSLTWWNGIQIQGSIDFFISGQRPCPNPGTID